jgi:general secretion pathway protein I
MEAAGNRAQGLNQGQAGFTLLEVLVALSILGIALTVILQIFSADLRNIKKAADYDEAAATAAARLRSIVEYEMTDKPASWTEKLPDGYTVAVSVDDYLQDRTENLRVKMMQIELTIQWPDGQKTKSLTLRTLKTVYRS